MTHGLRATLLADDDPTKLQLHLERRLASHFGEARTIQTVGRRLCPYTSSFRIDELDVKFDDGSSVRLVLKDLGRDGMIEQARRARPTFLYDPQREINAYRWILPHAPAGTAECYGAVEHRAAQRYWLLLEQVKGSQLWQVGNIGVWEETAAWIARLHGSFSPLKAQQIAERSGTLMYDAEFYWRWMHRAQRFATRDGARRRVIDRIARRYEPVVKRLTQLPRTIIHGEFYASNVLIKRRPSVRVCPVDWEMTALGPGLIDLAALTAGWAAPTQRVLARAYLAAQSGTKGRPSREFSTDLDCCRLHLAIRMLGWSDKWEPPADHARNWLRDASQISRRLQH